MTNKLYLSPPPRRLPPVSSSRSLQFQLWAYLFIALYMYFVFIIFVSCLHVLLVLDWLSSNPGRLSQWYICGALRKSPKTIAGNFT